MSTTQPEKYRKKPVEVTAWQWDGTKELAKRIVQWINDNGGEASVRSLPFNSGKHKVEIRIATLEGPIYASPKDVIIMGTFGEFYPCKPGIFAAVYEAVPVVPEFGPSAVFVV